MKDITNTGKLPDYKKCNHMHGWYDEIKIAKFVSIRIFICTDCNTVLYGQKLLDWEKTNGKRD